jgi:hypothetical protein
LRRSSPHRGMRPSETNLPHHITPQERNADD